MSASTTRLRELLDWRAAWIASVVGSLVFLLANIVLTALTVNGPWIVPRIVAAILRGSDALPPQSAFTFAGLLVATLIMLLLFVLAGIVLTSIFHRWGLIVGILGGAIFGLGVYAIVFFGLSRLAPWLVPFRSWLFLLTHVIFGAVTGGVYESLEVERYAPAPGGEGRER